jgi:hypothetical protein
VHRPAEPSHEFFGVRFMDWRTKIWPAVIAAVVALLGSALTLLAARWQVNSKVDELTQGQFKDVLAKRIEVYPQLWSIAQTMLSDWEREQKTIDSVWARKLLRDLMDWHARYGVLLSQGSYVTFAALRHGALQLVRKRDDGYVPTIADLQMLDRINTRGDSTKPSNDPLHLGLATWLKNDLGSYKTPFLAVQPR